MDTRGIDQMLSELRSVSQAAQGKAVSPADAPAGGVNFADVLGNALKDVSAAQGEARAMAQNTSTAITAKHRPSIRICRGRWQNSRMARW